MVNQNPFIVTTLSDWEVVQSKISATSLERNAELPGYKALLRSDTGALLNVCKKGYNPMSNASFIRCVERFADVTGFPIEAIYELEGGKKMLGFLKCTEPFEVGGFEFKDHLMVGNGHDGQTTFFVGNSNLMMRCQNRFARQYRSLKVKHSRGLEIGVERIQEEFFNYRKSLRAYYKSMNDFSKVEVSKEIHDSLVARLANLSKEERLGQTEISTRKQNIVSTIEACFRTEMADTGHTLFGLFNGLTNYTTHELGVTADNGMSMFNRAERLNLDGYHHCLNIANGHQLLKACDLPVFADLIA